MRRCGPSWRGFLAAVLVAGSGHGLAQTLTADFTFSPHDPAPGSAVQFTDTSTGPAPIFEWSWDFGDPGSGPSNHSPLQNPTHTFASAGEYSVTLTVDVSSRRTQTVHVEGGSGTCVTRPDLMCLNNNRFQVSANWTKPNGETGTGTAVSLTDDSGYFWFFDPANIEMVVKVLNGCGLNNAYWVFAAGLTNVRVDWLVRDTATGDEFPAVNPQGTPFAPVQNINAFPNSCP